MQSMKIRVKSPEHSAAIQNKMFEMGYSWAGPYCETFVRFTDQPYLYLSQKGIQMSGGGKIGDRLFEEDPAQEYLFEDGEFKLK